MLHSTNIRAIIVDDEPLARRGMRLRLEEEGDFEVLAEYGDAVRACAGIREHSPDVVFLDIQMPGMNGFDVARAIGDRSAVVFLTAHEAYALDAFAVRAIDYLLKPASDERIDRTLDRVRAHVATTRAAELGRRVSRMVHGDGRTGDGTTGEATPIEALRVRERGRIILIRPGQIDWIEAAGDYVRLHVHGRSHLARYTIGELEARLVRGFVRIHRGTLVNRSRIVELQPHDHGDLIRDD
jgi:two-component system LytT family response regulator